MVWKSSPSAVYQLQLSPENFQQFNAGKRLFLLHGKRLSHGCFATLVPVTRQENIDMANLMGFEKMSDAINGFAPAKPHVPLLLSRRQIALDDIFYPPRQ